MTNKMSGTNRFVARALVMAGHRPCRAPCVRPVGHHARLEALAREWEGGGAHGTTAARIKEGLSGLPWLEPLRPEATRDPFGECEIHPAGWRWHGAACPAWSSA